MSFLVDSLSDDSRTEEDDWLERQGETESERVLKGKLRVNLEGLLGF